MGEVFEFTVNGQVQRTEEDKSGDELSLTDIAAKLGVSRTPVLPLSVAESGRTH